MNKHPPSTYPLAPSRPITLERRKGIAQAMEPSKFYFQIQFNTPTKQWWVHSYISFYKGLCLCCLLEKCLSAHISQQSQGLLSGCSSEECYLHPWDVLRKTISSNDTPLFQAQLWVPLTPFRGLFQTLVLINLVVPVTFLSLDLL